MESQRASSPEMFERQEGLNIDFKRIAFRALRYWYLVVISLVLAMSIAFIRNRYAIPIYPVSASVIIRETEETGGAELLYKNALIDPYKNYLNEPYILKSYPLLQQVVEDLNFDMTFQRVGRILTQDAYDQLPVEAKLTKVNGSYGKSFMFKVIDQNSFSLKLSDDDKEDTFAFGKDFEYHGHHLIFKVKDPATVESYKDKEYRVIINDPEQVARSYSGRLDVEWAEKGAGILTLGLNGPVPQKEIDFLNGLIVRYQQNDLDRKNLVASRTVDFIDNQLRNISDSLVFFELQLETFKNKNMTTDLEGEALRLFQKLEGLDAQKTELAVRESYYAYVVKYISGGSNLDQIVLPTALGVSDAVLTELVTKMVQLQDQVKVAGSLEKGQNPLITGRQKAITAIKDDLLESVNTLRATDKIKVTFLDQQLASIEQQMRRLPLAQRQLVTIRRNYDLQENLFIYLMQKKAEADISRASNTSDVIVVNPPAIAGGAISPKTKQNYSVAFALGLLLPFSIFVLLELANNKIQSREDIEKITDIPFIGGIGHKKADSNLVVSSSPKSAVAESFRALRSNLNYFTGNEDKKIFLVTSSLSGEGKTFTSANLATVLALSGKKSLLMGADMRRPRIFKDFQLDNELGLSTYLSGLKDLKSVIQSTSIENLYLLAGGPVPPNPSELLLKPEVDRMFDELKQDFDYIILDTPPVALVTDAFVLSRYADHTIFVVRQNYTPKNILRTIHDYYKDGRIKNMSLVLNDIYRSGPGYGYGYGHSYGYGYGYGYGYSKNGKSKLEGNYYED